MDKNKNPYKLLNIILLESNFKREPYIDFKNSKFNNNINIRTDNTSKDNSLFVTVTVTFSSKIKQKKVINAKIIMAGMFEFSHNPNLSLETFANINAPAIIFPFIREHLSNISIKAGIQPILLPPINFVNLAKEKQI